MYVCMYTMCVCGALESQKVLDVTAVSHLMWVLGPSSSLLLKQQVH